MQTKRTLNIFTDQSHYSRQNRKYLHDMLRPYWYDRQYEQDRQIYGTWIDSYSVTDDIAEADFCLLPMNWTYYNDKDNLEAVLAANESLILTEVQLRSLERAKGKREAEVKLRPTILSI